MTTVAINRVLAAPVERVWAAFCDPDALMAWFWPGSLATKVTADVRPGGAYRISSDVGNMAISGIYRDVDEPVRLAFTWRWDGEDTDSLVTIELVALGDETELRLRHERLADDESRDAHAQGWNDCLDRLPMWL